MQFKILRHIDDFKKIQKYMLLPKEENTTKTHAELKNEYLTLKAILNAAGVTYRY